jgi:kynurenine formamidase
LLGLGSPLVATLSDREEFTAAPGIVLDAEIAIVESMVNLDALTQDEVTFLALRLKLRELMRRLDQLERLCMRSSP